jgi:ATP-dependent DNA ligase
MPNYEKYIYIYPPRPKNTINPKDLGDIDNGLLLAQLKFNGSNCLVFTNGESIHVMNRHNQSLTGVQIKDEMLKLNTLPGKWAVLNGEYLNKSKLDENGKPFNHKLIIFDVLVWDGEYLIGKTFAERVQLLDDIFGKNPSEKEYLWKISDNIYRAKTYLNDFSDLYDRYHKIDLIEGLVMKRKSAKLEIGNTENNNSKSQVKCRKETKNYKF